MQGVSRRYEYEIKQEATGDLTATVTKMGFAEQAKSLVETRAGLASFVNQGADYLVQDGLAVAQMSVSASDADKGGKNAQRKAVASDGAAYQLWTGAGANSMRAESGSYVDSKGWNLGVGWAREDVQKDGAKVLFSPFVEYGRGTYDSYLDDGTHGNGKISYIGAGILGKLTVSGSKDLCVQAAPRATTVPTSAARRRATTAQTPITALTLARVRPSRSRKALPSTPMHATSGRTRTA